MDALERMQGIIAGNNSRKGRLIAKGRERLKTAKLMTDMIGKFEDGTLTFDDPSNTEYAAAFAKLMGTASGVEIVKQFKYDSVEGAIADFNAWLSGDPQTTVTEEQLKEIKVMSMDMLKNEQEPVNRAVAASLNAFLPRLKRNPEVLNSLIEEYQESRGEVSFDPVKNRFSPILPSDISAEFGGRAVQPGQKSAAEYTGGSRKASPYGDEVVQDGVTYKWNGREYVEK
jgi:hypothetical protein